MKIPQTIEDANPREIFALWQALCVTGILLLDITDGPLEAFLISAVFAVFRTAWVMAGRPGQAGDPLDGMTERQLKAALIAVQDRKYDRGDQPYDA